MSKEFRFKEWDEKYHTKEFVDVMKYLTNNDKKILKKLGITVKEQIYIEYEFDTLKMELIKYYKDNTMDEEDLSIVVPLEGTGVSREEYNKLFGKFEKIEKEYENKQSKIYY